VIDQSVTTFFKYITIPRLDSIRNKILAFAVIATVLPSSIALWISYAQNRAALEAKISQGLLSESSQTAREMAVWLRERLYDLRVFASSYEVSENVGRFSRRESGSPAHGRLHDYLASLHDRFKDFDQLLVLDPRGRILATSAPEATRLRLPPGWLEKLRVEGQFVGDAYWDESAERAKLVVAVPIRRADGQQIGAFAAELDLGAVQQVLRSFATDSLSAVYLMSSEGALLASSRRMSSRLVTTTLNGPTLERLLQREGEAFRYMSFTRNDVVGALTRVPDMRWVVVTEIPSNAAFGQVRRFRNLALLVIAALLLVAAVGAYRFGVIIVRPLDRLTKGAAEVAAGDLAVDLPSGGAGEVGDLTTVFNHMVSRLRQSREELERLSLTDGLTGLANHRALMHRLNEEALRYRRTRRHFAVLMADVDHFKQFNDAFGHPAGDEVLKRLGAILRNLARETDCVARYGGEEFCLMLPETPVQGAATLAERLRARVEATDFGDQQITLSIGVASLPANGDTPEAVIAAADEALYEAKRKGRNRVMQPRKAKKARVKKALASVG
jgi:diguanylate cyclase (GGDEF)-like protein